MVRRPPRSTRTDTLVPYTTLCRSDYAHRAAVLANGRDGGEGHHLPARRADLETADVRAVVARGRLRLGRHAEGAAEQVEVVDIGRAQISAERFENLRRLEIGRAHV